MNHSCVVLDQRENTDEHMMSYHSMEKQQFTPAFSHIQYYEGDFFTILQ